MDTELSCDDFGDVPKTCIPCDQFEGPVCAFQSIPESGSTLVDMCSARGQLYILPNACPPECSEERPCDGAFEVCINGTCQQMEP